MNFTDIIDAIHDGTLEDVKPFIEQGVDINAKSDFNPLCMAALKGKVEIVKFLISHRANVNVSDDTGLTPLHAAASIGNTEIVNILVSKGADLNARSNKYSTPLYDAIFNGNMDVAKVLISTGADVNAKDKDGNAPLHAAIFKTDIEVIKLLISNGADINIKAGNGFTPLHAAAGIGNVDFVKILISANADVNANDNADGVTPLHVAVDRENIEVIKVLVSNDADVNIKEKRGLTPLAVAIQMEKTDVIGYLSDIEMACYTHLEKSAIAQCQGCGRSLCEKCICHVGSYEPKTVCRDCKKIYDKNIGGCYVATAIYGSYDAPEVLCLRRFRDEILAHSIFGRLFIKLYYRFSPSIAERLKTAQRMNMFIRKILDKIVIDFNKKFHNQNEEV